MNGIAGSGGVDNPPVSGGSRGVVPPDQHGVAVITLADVPPVELAGGSWSRVLVAEQTVGGNASALASTERREPVK